MLLAAAVLFFSCSEERDHILKIYNWADYIDEELLAEFEDWYFEQTGEEVKIIYQTFDINETMLSKIELGHEDYDVVCPSDYIIERMLRSDLLLPINKDFGNDEMKCLSKLTIEVQAFAVQTNGFANCLEAMTTAFETQFAGLADLYIPE